MKISPKKAVIKLNEFIELLDELISNELIQFDEFSELIQKIKGFAKAAYSDNWGGAKNEIDKIEATFIPTLQSELNIVNYAEIKRLKRAKKLKLLLIGWKQEAELLIEDEPPKNDKRIQKIEKDILALKKDVAKIKVYMPEFITKK